MHVPQKPIKIVLAEDEPTIAAAYQQSLNFRGFEVVIASNGQEALEAIAADPPDILLLDIIMPQMDGMEALVILRSNPAFAFIPVIMLTNLGQPEDTDRIDEIGAQGYPIKSNLSVDELVDQIRAIVSPT